VLIGRIDRTKYCYYTLVTKKAWSIVMFKRGEHEEKVSENGRRKIGTRYLRCIINVELLPKGEQFH